MHRVWSATDSHPAVDQKPADSRWAGPSPANEWLPPGGLEDRSRWRGIIIHHSATDNGNAEYFNQMHKKRGWRGLGYHFVINNGHGGLDGSVEVGWRWRSQEEGAHCHPESAPDNWYNEHTIGIGLVGDFEKAPPSPAQMASLVQLVRFLQDRYAIGSDKIIGHRDAKGAKTKCPGRLFPFAELRRELR